MGHAGQIGRRLGADQSCLSLRLHHAPPFSYVRNIAAGLGAVALSGDLDQTRRNGVPAPRAAASLLRPEDAPESGVVACRSQIISSQSAPPFGAPGSPQLGLVVSSGRDGEARIGTGFISAVSKFPQDPPPRRRHELSDAASPRSRAYIRDQMRFLPELRLPELPHREVAPSAANSRFNFCVPGIIETGRERRRRNR